MRDEALAVGTVRGRREEAGAPGSRPLEEQAGEPDASDGTPRVATSWSEGVQKLMLNEATTLRGSPSPMRSWPP